LLRKAGKIGVYSGTVKVGRMAEARWPPDDGEQQPQAPAGRGGGGGGGGTAAEGNRQSDVDVTTHYSDDERSVAADSWSVKSEYGSTLDGEDQRTADVVDALNAAAAFRPSEYLYVFFSLIIIIPLLFGFPLSYICSDGCCFLSANRESQSEPAFTAASFVLNFRSYMSLNLENMRTFPSSGLKQPWTDCLEVCRVLLVAMSLLLPLSLNCMKSSILLDLLKEQY
jgi:hypothetical protein